MSFPVSVPVLLSPVLSLCLVRGQLFVRGGGLLVPGQRSAVHRLLHEGCGVLLVHALQWTTTGEKTSDDHNHLSYPPLLSCSC